MNFSRPFSLSFLYLCQVSHNELFPPVLIHVQYDYRNVRWGGEERLESRTGVCIN